MQMSATATQALILDSATDYGVAILAILGAVITIGLGMLVFRFGWRKVKGSTR